MNKIVKWIKDSHRLQHFAGGVAIGLLADDTRCAALAGTGVAGALEFKDMQWGGKPDVIDFIVTCAGVAAGYGLRLFCLRFVFS